MTLYEALKTLVCNAAETLALPLGWEGEPFVPPHDPHLRAQAVFTEARQASLGSGGLAQEVGRLEVKVVTAAGEDVLAATLASQLVRHFPRGMNVLFDNGRGTITLPHASAPASDGSRTYVLVTIPFYAFSASIGD